VGLAGKIHVVTVATRAHVGAGVLLAQGRLAESVVGRVASRLEEGHVAADRERAQTVAGWNSRVSCWTRTTWVPVTGRTRGCGVSRAMGCLLRASTRARPRLYPRWRGARAWVEWRSADVAPRWARM